MKLKQFREKLGKMSGSKLTGQEISVYMRKNPSAKKDPKVRKGVEFALDHGGAMTFAVKGIEKIKKGLSSHPEVKKALQYANESTLDQMKEDLSEGNYAQELDLAQKNIARLSKKESGQDKKDYQAVARALNQGNLGAVKKVIKGISTKEIQADILNVLVGYNDLIAKMYPKAMSGGKFKSGMTVDKMIKEESVNEELGEVRPFKKGWAPAEWRIVRKDKKIEKDIEKFYKSMGGKYGDPRKAMTVKQAEKNIPYLYNHVVSNFGVVNNTSLANAIMKFYDHWDNGKGVYKTEEAVLENYRTLARKGMGAETRKSIKVGTVVDFYDNNGNKREGTIIKLGQIGDGYTLKDNKDGKLYKFKYHDRMKAKKLLRAYKEDTAASKSLKKKGAHIGSDEPEKTVHESDAAWAKSLEKIKKQRQLDRISDDDKATLRSIMALLDKEKRGRK